MSRRCRASLQERASQGSAAASSLDSGCDCGRLTGGVTKVCEEPMVYGTNVLPDPSLEQHLAITGAGPNADEVPYTLSGGGMYWPSSNGRVTDLTGSGWNGSGWVHYPGVSSGVPFWKLSSVNPHQGAFHLRFTTPSPGGTIRNLRAVGFMDCSGEFSTDHIPLTAVIGPGDLVVWSMFIMDSLGAGGNFNLRLGFLINAPGLAGTFTQENFVCPSSYQAIGMSAFVPQAIGVSGPPPHYLLAETVSLSGHGSANNIDLDSAQLSILQAGQGILLCAQSGLITIDNDTTETAFL